MSKPNHTFTHTHETKTADTLAAALAVTLTLSAIVVFGQHLAPNESGGRVQSHEQIFSAARLVKQSSQKTERAKAFDGTVKSDKYWKDLRVSIAKPKKRPPAIEKSKKPPVVIGSK